MTFQIVFQHPDFIVINKPNGISVHKDDADVDAARDNLTMISAINQIKYFTHTETKLQKVW